MSLHKLNLLFNLILLLNLLTINIKLYYIIILYTNNINNKYKTTYIKILMNIKLYYIKEKYLAWSKYINIY